MGGAKGYSWLHSGPCKELQPTVIEFYLAWKSRDWFHLRNVTSNPGTQQHASQPGTFLWSLEHLGTYCQYYWYPCLDVLDRSLNISPIWDQKCRTQDNEKLKENKVKQDSIILLVFREAYYRIFEHTIFYLGTENGIIKWNGRDELEEEILQNTTGININYKGQLAFIFVILIIFSHYRVKHCHYW